MILNQGFKLGKYVIKEQLGEPGSYGVVFRAEEDITGKEVAIKEFFINGDKEELKVLASLNHPNIIQYITYELYNNTHFLIMEYAAGGSLADIIAQKGSLSETEALEILRQITNAVAYAHQHKIVHRDIKPLNILHCQGNTYKLGDFGISRFLDKSMTGTKGRGSIYYAAPELFKGQFSNKTDVYALGVAFYEMLTGDLPYTGTEYEVIGKIIDEKLRPQIPAGLSQLSRSVLEGCLEKDLSKRWDIDKLVTILDLSRSKSKADSAATVGRMPTYEEKEPSTDNSSRVADSGKKDDSNNDFDEESCSNCGAADKAVSLNSSENSAKQKADYSFTAGNNTLGGKQQVTGRNRQGETDISNQPEINQTINQQSPQKQNRRKPLPALAAVMVIGIVLIGVVFWLRGMSVNSHNQAGGTGNNQISSANTQANSTNKQTTGTTPQANSTNEQASGTTPNNSPTLINETGTKEKQEPQAQTQNNMTSNTQPGTNGKDNTSNTASGEDNNTTNNNTVKKMEHNVFLSGTATNILYSAVKAGISFVITKIDDVNCTAKGSYDNKNLFGKFDIPGICKIDQTTGKPVYIFNGEIHLGDDGSGYPSGTTTDYTMTIDFNKTDGTGKIMGTYVVGLLPSYNSKQNGILFLNYDRTVQ